ncbi:MAG: HAD hydrolase family protein [Candidatus Omnitrophica bacterium]|nr:HAD hydrolase family protein [Candidatus Omnitrophota bacterium]MBD3269568.1 HAD hydrolase family protein [Candidatus Omnitrophota bacterium]
MPKNKKTIFKKVKLLVLDVDGVLTKGEIIYDSTGRELKIFNVKDGLGIYLLSKMDIPTIFLSARNSPMLKKRAKDMGVREVIGGILPKENHLNYITDKYKVEAGKVCFIGDDLIDIGIMENVGIGVAVRDAPLIVRKKADYVTLKRGGEGAVREVVDLIFKAKNLEKKVYNFVKNPL